MEDPGARPRWWLASGARVVFIGMVRDCARISLTFEGDPWWPLEDQRGGVGFKLPRSTSECLIGRKIAVECITVIFIRSYS